MLLFHLSVVNGHLLSKILELFEKQGIKVDERQFTCRGSMGPIQAGHPNKADFDALASFVESTLE